MRRLVVIAVALGALGTAEPAIARPQPPSGISGEVRNTTCYGPCREPPPPAPLYTGDGLVVKIRNLGTHRLLAVLHPKDGTFAVDAGPGRYHVHAYVNSTGRNPSNCWGGSAKNVGIVDQGVRVDLTVQNDCIV